MIKKILTSQYFFAGALTGFGLFLAYTDHYSAAAERCHVKGGAYDVLPGGYGGPCYKLTVIAEIDKEALVRPTEAGVEFFNKYGRKENAK